MLTPLAIRPARHGDRRWHWPQRLLTVAPLLAIALIGGCRCESPERTAQHPDTTKRVDSGRASGGAGATVATRERMRQLSRLTAELRRRVKGGVSLTAPAQRLAALAGGVVTRGRARDYTKRKEQLTRRALALAASVKAQPDAFNRLLESCHGCHTRHIGRVSKGRAAAAHLPQPL